MDEDSSYYVYVYIDPRNFEEFYYGKGRGSRKYAQLDGETARSERIFAIRKEGLEPIIRVVAARLTETQAYLVEKTLIWKLGKNLLNVSGGFFAENFRPDNSLHKHLSGFDFENGIYYVNVGEGEHRCWEDSRTYGFLAAGNHPRFRDQISGLQSGDVAAAYITRRGYVGLGIVLASAVPADRFMVDGVPLNEKELKQPGIFHDSGDPDLCEYLVSIRWIKTVSREEAFWRTEQPRLFAPQKVRANLASQRVTLKFLEESFAIDFEHLA